MEKQEDLIELVIEALRASKKVRLTRRITDIEYDERNAVILENFGPYNGFFVGDRVWVSLGRPGPLPLCVTKSEKIECIIAAFAKMTAKIRGVRGIKRENVFCVLASPESPSSCPHHRIFMTIFPEGPVRLFWLEEVQKVK